MIIVDHQTYHDKQQQQYLLYLWILSEINLAQQQQSNNTFKCNKYTSSTLFQSHLTQVIYSFIRTVLTSSFLLISRGSAFFPEFQPVFDKFNLKYNVVLFLSSRFSLDPVYYQIVTRKFYPPNCERIQRCKVYPKTNMVNDVNQYIDITYWYTKQKLIVQFARSSRVLLNPLNYICINVQIRKSNYNMLDSLVIQSHFSGRGQKPFNISSPRIFISTIQ
ncbi:Hypothetical_protein [Hexamita inflata]|uniref:Hypothetical_protein n=1 Tax=Hexamita inflata TaxID=28002 RepID=A0AA86N6F9_9EUKA|nr:Hypothetical protein HINF_LOCUS1360 [Hexamita inflata]